MEPLNFNFLKEGRVAVERRSHQVAIARQIRSDKENIRVVIDISLGKTILAFMVADKALLEGQVLLMAPTRPLCDQHYKDIGKYFKIKAE